MKPKTSVLTSKSPTRIPLVGGGLILLVVGATVGSMWGRDRVAQAEPRPCSTYQIEGMIEPVDPEKPLAPRQASVFLHLGETGLANHQVFATFVDGNAATIDEPALLTTDQSGRAMVDIPAGAVNVSFVAESARDSACAGPSSDAETLADWTNDEVTVVAATIPVQPVSGDLNDESLPILTYGPTEPRSDSGGSGAMTETSVTTDTSGERETVAEGSELAKTGPVTAHGLAIAVIALASGLGLGLGRGRRTAG